MSKHLQLPEAMHSVSTQRRETQGLPAQVIPDCTHCWRRPDLQANSSLFMHTPVQARVGPYAAVQGSTARSQLSVRCMCQVAAVSHFGQKSHRRCALSSRLGCKQICHCSSACGVLPLRVRVHLSGESKVICCSFEQLSWHNAQVLTQTRINVRKTVCHTLSACSWL